MTTEAKTGPEGSAVRVALWRALHLEVDAPPPVFEDDIGLRLADPAPGWRRRPDMNRNATSRNRASIVARARFVEDLVGEKSGRGVSQYVLLGAGLETFVQRRPDLAQDLQVYEIDRQGPQDWKKQRLAALGYELPASLHFVPVDFESGKSWRDALAGAGFDADAPSIVVSAGVSLYLTHDAIMATLRDCASLAPGSVLAMSYMLPIELVEAGEHGAIKGAARGAAASGTPFISLFVPDEIVALARGAGFSDVEHVSAADLEARYFAGRSDGLRPSSAEALIVATV